MCSLPLPVFCATPKPPRGTLSLCCPDANRELTVRKRDGDAFKAARKAGWGDAFEY